MIFRSITAAALPLLLVTSLASASSASVNINEADAEGLQALVGVGPATAAAIIQDRADNGPYESAEALTRVNGIGVVTLDAIREQITLE